MVAKAKPTGHKPTDLRAGKRGIKISSKSARLIPEGAVKITLAQKNLPKELVAFDKSGRFLGRYYIGSIAPKVPAKHGRQEKVVADRLEEKRGQGGPLILADRESRARTLAAARERGAIIADDIMTSADMASSGELAAEFGMTRQAIDKRFRNGQLLGLSTAKRGRKYPAAQFDRNGRLLPGVAQVLAHFKGDGWGAWRFLSTEHIELGNRTGFVALKDGAVDAVMNLLLVIDQGAFS